MTGVRDPAVEDLLAAVRRDFAAKLPERGAELSALVARAAWDDLRRASHKLRGSAASYGFVELGAHAAAIEDLLLEAADAGAAPDVAARARIQELVTAATAACERAAREGA
jgi:HPt (histidine-containing phosphotransfer) domain-containing protein